LHNETFTIFTVHFGCYNGDIVEATKKELNQTSTDAKNDALYYVIIIIIIIY